MDCEESNQSLNKTEKRKYTCEICEYSSDRKFNVIRHEERIHSPILQRVCCDESIRTKGQWYHHCAKFHPNLRVNSIISKQKYKIFEDSKQSVMVSMKNVKEIEQRRTRMKKRVRNERLMTSNQLDYTIDEFNLENVPLIHFIENRELQRKFIENFSDTDNKNNHSTPSIKNESNNIRDTFCKDSLSLTTKNENGISEQTFYDCKNKTTATETVQYKQYNNESNIWHDYTRNIRTDIRSQSIKIQLNLPLKKRILRKFCIESDPIYHDQRLGAESVEEHENFDSQNKENYKPTSHHYANAINMHQKRTVIKVRESNTWNEITKRQRDYLSAMDWEQFKKL